MGLKIAEANPGAPAQLADRIPVQRGGGDDTPYYLTPGDIASLFWPVGALFLSVVATDPAALLGFGTWSQIAGGRFLVGQTGGDADFDVAEETGGSKTSDALLAHTHGITDLGHNHVQDSHNHTQNAHQHGMAEGQTDGAGTFVDRSNAASAASAVTDNATATNQATTATNQANATGITVNSAGSGASFSILPPYLVVYIWKRTA